MIAKIERFGVVCEGAPGEVCSMLHGISTGWPNSVSLGFAITALESFILAQFAAGIDITTDAYAEALTTALDAIENNLDL